MNSVRKTEAWTAYDGTVHPTERAALLASVAAILAPSQFGLRDAETIDKNLPTLMPLFQRLMDPRNRGREAPQAIPSQEMAEPMRDEGDVFVDAAPGEAINGGLAPQDGIPRDEIVPNDLREGQIIETLDANNDVMEVLVMEVTKDCEPAAGVIGYVILNGKPATEMPAAIVPLDEIIRIVSQPEDRMSLDEAKAALKALSDGELENRPSEEDAVKLHKQRILLHRRIEALSRGED